MLAELLRDVPMSNDFESLWMPVNCELPENRKNILKAGAIQICWQNVTGNLDGIITVCAANDINYKVKIKNITISTASNTDDALMFLILPGYQYIKVEYQCNGITGGRMSAFISYN